MKIINIKFNFKYFVSFICSIIVILSIFFLINLFSNNIINLNNVNYTTILKEVHNKPSDYINKKINMTGYVFRANDFNDNQFVVARDMIVSENDYRIVGFLCESNEIESYENNVWIEILGIIKLKDYNGPMPIVEVYEIHKITTPNDSLVYPPKTWQKEAHYDQRDAR